MSEPDDRQAAREGELQKDFCAFLNSDRSEAGLSPAEVANHRGKRYVELHARLARLFAWRGCHEPEALADRALDRAKQKWAEKRDSGQAAPRDNPNPAAYVCSFVRFVFLEWLAEQHTPELPVPPGRADEEEAALDCLDQCLEEILEAEARTLILEYYQGAKRAKIDHRQVIAKRYNLSANALRIECYRIRRRLRTCVLACMSRKRPETIPQNGAFPSEEPPGAKSGETQPTQRPAGR